MRKVGRLRDKGFNGGASGDTVLGEVLNELPEFDYFSPERTVKQALDSLSAYSVTEHAEVFTTDPPTDVDGYYEFIAGLGVEDVRAGLGAGVYQGAERDFAIAFVTASDLNFEVHAPFLDCNNFTELLQLCEDEVCRLQMNSTPGYPYTQHNSTYGALVDDPVYYNGFRDFTRLVVCSAFTVLNTCTFDGEPCAETLLEGGVLCVSKAFVKNEPNGTRKRGSPRIVVGQSGHVRIATAVLSFNEPIPMGTSSYCYGWGNTADNVRIISEKLRERLEGFGGVIVKSDVTGWEKSVSRRTLRWIQFIRALLAKSPQSVLKPYQVIAETIAHTTYLGLYGDLYTKIRPGQQCSGHHQTTANNATGRTAFAVSHGGFGYCNGDDMIEQTTKRVSDLVDGYNRQKLRVRGAEVCTPEKFEFCSHVMGVINGVPYWAHDNASKSIWRQVVEGSTLTEVVAALSPNFSSLEQAEEFLRLCARVHEQLLAHGYESCFDIDAGRAMWQPDEFVYETSR